MVPIPPLDLTTVDSRSALIAAAIELYAAKGQAALTTREIADLAQVNQGPDVADLHEPRLTVMATSAFSLGVTLWDDILRRMIGIPADADLVPMIADITEYLLRVEG